MICIHRGMGLREQMGSLAWLSPGQHSKSLIPWQRAFGIADYPGGVHGPRPPLPPPWPRVTSQTRQAHTSRRSSHLPYKGSELPQAAATRAPGREIDLRAEGKVAGRPAQLDRAAWRTQKHGPEGSVAGKIVPPRDAHILLLEPANVTWQRD